MTRDSSGALPASQDHATRQSPSPSVSALRAGIVSAATPGPWEYVPSSEHHGPYVAGPFGGDICDCYTMTLPGLPSARNGGESQPVHFMGTDADANARLIAAAPELLEALRTLRAMVDKRWPGADFSRTSWAEPCSQADAAISKATGQ